MLRLPISLVPLTVTVCAALSLAGEVSEEPVQKVLFVAKLIRLQTVERNVRGEFRITDVLSGPKDLKERTFSEMIWSGFESPKVGQKSLWLGRWNSKGLLPIHDAVHACFEGFPSPVWDCPGGDFDEAVKLARAIGHQAGLSETERLAFWHESAFSEVPAIAAWGVRSLAEPPTGRDDGVREVRQLLKSPRLPLAAQFEADSQLQRRDDKWQEDPSRLQMYDSWTKMKLGAKQTQAVVEHIGLSWQWDAKHGRTYCMLLSAYARSSAAPIEARVSALGMLGCQFRDPEAGETILEVMKETLAGRLPQEMQVRAVIELSFLPAEKDNVRLDLWRRMVAGDHTASVREEAMRCLFEHDKGKPATSLDLAIRVLRASDAEEVRRWAKEYILQAVLGKDQLDELRKAMEGAKGQELRDFYRQALEHHGKGGAAKS